MNTIWHGSGALPPGVAIQIRTDIDVSAFPDTRSSTEVVRIGHLPLWVVVTVLQFPFMFDPSNPPLSNDRLRKKYPCLDLMRDIDKPYLTAIIHGIYADDGCLGRPHERLSYHGREFKLLITTIYSYAVCMSTSKNVREAALARLYTWKCSKFSCGNADVDLPTLKDFYHIPPPVIDSSTSSVKTKPKKTSGFFRELRKTFFRNKD